MPIIKITDTLSADVQSVSVTPNPIASALEKYVNDPALNVVLLPDFIEALTAPLLTARQTPLSLGLKFSDNLDLSASTKPELTIKAGATQQVNVNATPGSALLATDLFGSPVNVKDGEGWLSMALKATTNAGVNGAAKTLQFGFKAGGTIASEYFRPFAVTPEKPTVAEAFSSLFSDFNFPADVQDLNAMKNGDLCTVSGNGSLEVSTGLSVSADLNPLATPTLPIVDGPISLVSGAGVNVVASFSLSGTYQLRTHSLGDGFVEFGIYRKRGTQWSVDVTSSAGVDATIAKTDLIAEVLSALTGKEKAEVARLVSPGLTDEEIDRISAAINESISRSLKLSLEQALSVSENHEAAFLYHLDLARLNRDEHARSGVVSALAGDFSKLAEMEKRVGKEGALAPGITLVRSALKEVRDRKVSLRINLLGVLNFSSVFELLSKSETIFEPETGELTIKEKVSGTTAGTLIKPWARDKLRKIRFDSLLMTTAYRATGVAASLEMSSSDLFLSFDHNTNQHTMSDYLDAVVSLGLLSVSAKHQLLAAFHGGGPSSCILRAEFNDAACEAMFLDKNGIPRAETEYEAIGRRVLRGLLQPGDQKDTDRYRREILDSDETWHRLKRAGQANFRTVLPALADDPVRLGLVNGDYTEVTWWAESMGTTARKLAEVRNHIGSASVGPLRRDPKLIGLTENLRRHVAQVVENSGLRFGLPFGLVALYNAAVPFAVSGAIIISETLTKVFLPVP